MIRIGLACVALGLGLAAAHAQSPQELKKPPAMQQAIPPKADGLPVADTLRQWGLIGTWAVDCSKPPGSGQTHIRYVVWMGGKTMTERDFGDPKNNDSNEVVAATINKDGTITLVVDFVSLKQVRTFALMRGGADRVRAFWNRGPDGAFTVQDGKFTDGRETPWQYRCDGKQSRLPGDGHGQG